MQFYSFDLRDPVFEFDTWRLSFQIVTLENVYGLAPEATSIDETGNGWQLTCSRLSWAGQQRQKSGRFEAFITRETGGQVRLQISADAPHKIRAVKVLLRGLARPAILDMLDGPQEIPSDGQIDRYPNRLRLPVYFLAMPDGSFIGVRSEDRHTRAKRFAAYREHFGECAGDFTLECIHEEDARWFDRHISVPDWILTVDVRPAEFRDAQLAFNESAVGLVSWERRVDMPAWVRDLRLCLTIHGMHWSGYTFNTYAQMLEIIKYAAERVDGVRILAYLPGWEGRYYWQYGDYRPEPLLGGEEGFARLCAEARGLGVHVMPMFGGNCANSWAPNFHTFGPPSYMKSATRNIFHGNQPDWDISREYDTGWQAWLNPGAPAWQRELCNQILNLISRYEFDAVFLDTIEVWVNDPDFNIREGLRQMYDRLRVYNPDLLVAGEDWWDGLLGIFPIFQQTSMWRQVPDWVGRYARLIGHICDSEASRGSTGVFESGYRLYSRLPQTEPYITTITFVDNTFAQARDEVDALLGLAAAQDQC
jgi:hypothetical protein